jgi:hypothetical protein
VSQQVIELAFIFYEFKSAVKVPVWAGDLDMQEPGQGHSKGF